MNDKARARCIAVILLAQDLATILFEIGGLASASDVDLGRRITDAGQVASEISSTFAWSGGSPIFSRAKARGLVVELEGASRLPMVDPSTNAELKLFTALRSATSRAFELSDAIDKFAKQSPGSSGRWPVVPAANRLAGLAMRLLPATARCRYAQEFQSELWELAQAGEPRRRQIGYAWRQLRSALFLRAELAAPSRRKASP
jgi:hypothetical protein